MPENSNLPAISGRFREAMQIDNASKRESAVSRIFGEIHVLVQSAIEDHAMIVNQATTFRLRAEDAETRRQDHARAFDLAIDQGDQERARQQGRERNRWAAAVVSHRAEAEQYASLARSQMHRVEDLKDLEAELQSRYRTVEREATVAFAELRFQQSLGVHQAYLHDIDTARERVHTAQIEAARLRAVQRTDAAFDSMLIGVQDRRQSVDDEIERRMRERGTGR